MAAVCDAGGAIFPYAHKYGRARRFVRRTTGGELQRAGGHEADYVVANREMVVTGKPGEQPWMSAEGRRLYSDRIIVDVVTETMRGENGTATTEK